MKRALSTVLVALLTLGGRVEARETAALSAQAVAAYQLLEVVAPDAVPGEFDSGALPLRCATPLAVAAANARSGADPLTDRLLARALQRPFLEHEIVSPAGYFRVHYDVDGREAVDPTDDDGNGVPDYVDLTAMIADSAWQVQIEQLGYNTPPSDGGAGGGNEVDIYILDLGRTQNYGITFPTSSGAAGPSFVEIDNDYTDAIFGNTYICPGHSGTRGADALRVTVAHELFHVVQFGYYQGSDGRWWQEASATWMEDVCYPAQDDYLQYVCSFVLSPGRALDSGFPGADFHAYGAAVFAHFLDQRYGRDLIRGVWEEHSSRRNASLDNFDRALVDYNGTVLGVTGTEAGIERAFSDLAVWSWFVGERFRDDYFTDGDAYPDYFVPGSPVAAKTVVSDDGRLDHMATRYVRFEPRLLTGGATIDTELSRGRWRRRLLLVSPDSVEVRDLGEDGAVTLAGWDAYDEVVLVISNVDVIGIGYEYEVMVEYDPDLSGAPAPLSTVLRPGQPNPYRPTGRDAGVLIPFELRVPSTRTRLSVFAVDGQLVWRYVFPGALSASRHTKRWDGTNENGALVAPGIYYVILETDRDARSRPLAVVRN